MVGKLAYFLSAQARECGHSGLMLDLVAKAWCADQEHDVLPRSVVAILGGIAGLVGNDVDIAVGRLVACGMWRHHVDGYVIEAD